MKRRPGREQQGGKVMPGDVACRTIGEQEPGRNPAPAIGATKCDQFKALAESGTEGGGKAFPLGFVLSRCEPGEADQTAILENEVAMALEAGEPDLAGFLGRSTVFGSGGPRRRRNRSEPRKHDKGRLHPHALYAKRIPVRPGSSAG